MEILYRDDAILVVRKPAGVLSTDEPGGVPELARRELGDERAELRTVHRLDRVVGGLMVLARKLREGISGGGPRRDAGLGQPAGPALAGQGQEDDLCGPGARQGRAGGAA